MRGLDHDLVRAGELARATLDLGRGQGTMVTDHRTSWVQQLDLPSGPVFIKTYEYPSWWSRLRDFGKRTAPWTRSRAAAEFDALRWMRRRDFPAPEPLLVGEHRSAGLLTRATLVTAAFAGEAVPTWLERLGPEERAGLARAIGTLVVRLHQSGFRDRNLDLRNLLARQENDGTWVVAKIDSPRHRLRAAGRDEDDLTRADWARLLPQLAPFDLDAVAAAAAGRPER